MSEDDTVLERSDLFGRHCRHNKFSVDVSKGYVECAICGEHLNPMWVLEQMCNSEHRHKKTVERLQEKARKADAKNRCKCEKCGQMTRVEK